METLPYGRRSYTLSAAEGLVPSHNLPAADAAFRVGYYPASCCFLLNYAMYRPLSGYFHVKICHKWNYQFLVIPS